MDLYNIYNSNVDLDDLNRYLSQYHIGLKKYDDERLLFESSLRDTSVPYNNLRAQARGCVIDMIDNKFLCIPAWPHRYFNEVSYKDIESQSFKVYEAEDGTQITLYSFEGVLSLGTTKSADVTHFKWNGDITMAKLFWESALLYPEFINKTGLRWAGESLAWNIPSNYSVTLGFHNSKIHPSSKTNKVWLIGIMDNNNGQSVEMDLSLPTNTSVDIDLSSMITKCNRSIEENEKDKFYGYILENTDTKQKFGALYKIFIPSTYYSLLSSVFYANIQDPEVCHTNRYKYQIVNNILKNNITTVNTIGNISSEYKKIVQNSLSTIENICIYTKMLLKNNNPPDNKYTEIVELVVQDIRDNEPDIHKNTPRIDKVITDYIYNTKYIKNILEIIN